MKEFVPIPIILLTGFLVSSFLLFNFVVIDKAYSSSDGPSISPEVQWSDNLEGVLSYCIYEGTVTLDSVNDPQAFCVIPTNDEPFESMYVNLNDDREIYELETIRLPENVFEDEYSVCAAFFPLSPQDARFNSAERCQTFAFEDENLDEEPLINLDEGAVYTTGGINMEKDEISPATNSEIISLDRNDTNETKNTTLQSLSIDKTSNLTGMGRTELPTQVNKTTDGNKTTSQLPITGITNQF